MIGTFEVAGGGRRARQGAADQPARGHRGGGSPETATGPREELTAPAGYGSSAGPPTRQSGTAPAGARPPYTGPKGDVHAEVLVLGAGPGGYTAAFRAADLGKKVVMVDSRGPLGGVCLNVGCIPSKALLHAAKVIAETKEMAAHGMSFGVADDRPRRAAQLEGRRRRQADRRPDRSGQAAQGHDHRRHRNLHLAEHGVGRRPGRVDDHRVASTRRSSPPARSRCKLPFIPHDDPRVIDSTGALDLDGIPERLLVLGGGIIGLEMATVYSELGSQDHAWSS